MTNHRYLPPSCGVSRRRVIASLAGFAAGAVLASGASGAPLLTRPIPTSGEAIPTVGLGTWITFNVGDDRKLRDERARVLAAFFEQGGGLIDSSPMYGSSEAVIGDGLRRLSHPRGLFAATKVWTPFPAGGIDQMAQSRRLWGVERFDLMQVHNLVNWKGHLPALLEDKRAGRIRHVGITTSHGSRHDEMVRVMRSQPIDAVQFSYNILDRDAERELLPLAADRGLAVIVNRPFRTGELFERFGRHPLPDFALELGCLTWSQFLLKFVISHPAVTCAIPATSRRDHLLENMAVLTGGLPDAAMRARMIRHVESL